MDGPDEQLTRTGELTLQDYLAIFLRRRWLVLTVFAATLAAITIYNVAATPTYESTSSVLLRTTNNEQLFPAVPQAQRNDFLRKEAAEFEYASSSLFERAAMTTTPAGTTVEPRIDDENQTSLLEFVARSSDPDDARAGAAAWVSTYLELRRATAIDRIAVSVLDTESQIAELEVQKAAILEPLAPIEEALQAETDPDTISRLTTQRLSLTQALEDELLPVDIQLRELSQNLARLRIAEGLVEREGVSEQLSTEASPAQRVAPQMARNTALAAVLGSLLAAGAALIAESLTATIRSAGDLRRLAPTVPVLAQIPDLPKDTSAHELAYRNGSHYAEEIERLISAVLYQRVGRPGNRMKVLVTSALPGEGKTTVAANLARRLSLTQVRTLIVDADLRRPKLHNELGLPRSAGLSELLASRTNLASHFVPLPSGGNVRVLGAGAGTDRAASLLRQTFRPAIERLPLDYELLIVDAPPVLAVTDAEVLVDAVDTVLLVVRAHNTKTGQITQAIRQLATLGASLGGFVLVGVRDEETTSYSYSYGTAPTARPSGRSTAGQDRPTRSERSPSGRRTSVPSRPTTSPQRSATAQGQRGAPARQPRAT